MPRDDDSDVEEDELIESDTDYFPSLAVAPSVLRDRRNNLLLAYRLFL